MRCFDENSILELMFVGIGRVIMVKYLYVYLFLVLSVYLQNVLCHFGVFRQRRGPIFMLVPRPFPGLMNNVAYNQGHIGRYPEPIQNSRALIISQNQPIQGNQAPYTNEAQPSPGNQVSNTDQYQPNQNSRGLNISENQPIQGNQVPHTNESQPSPGNQVSNTDQYQPNQNSRGLNISENRPIQGNQVPHTNESQPSPGNQVSNTDQYQPNQNSRGLNISENQPIQGNQVPHTNESQPSPGNQVSNTDQYQPNQNSRGLNISENQPYQGNQVPHTNESQPSPGNQVSNTDQYQPNQNSRGLNISENQPIQGNQVPHTNESQPSPGNQVSNTDQYQPNQNSRGLNISENQPIQGNQVPHTNESQASPGNQVSNTDQYQPNQNNRGLNISANQPIQGNQVPHTNESQPSPGNQVSNTDQYRPNRNSRGLNMIEPCQTVDGGVGSCKNLYKCETYLKMIQGGWVNPDTLSLLRKAQCGFNERTPKVCCPIPPFASAMPETTTTIEATTTEATTTEATTTITTIIETNTAPLPLGTTTGSEHYLPAFPEQQIRNTSNTSIGRTVGGATAKLVKPCQTIDGGVGSCKSLYKCKTYFKIIQGGWVNPDTVSLLRKAHCGFNERTPEVCCPISPLASALPETTTTTATTTTPTTTTTTTTTTETNTAPPPLGSTTGSEQYLPAFPEPPVCGTSNKSIDRIVGGVNAKLGAFPWMALLGYKRGSDTLWLCGGSLISSRHVLTAAHCIHRHDNDLYLVRLGELDLASEIDGATPLDVLIKAKFPHEDYNSTNYSNDIGVLLLDNDVQFTELIKPICIPRSSELRVLSFEKYNPLVAGWGSIGFRQPAATHLQVVQLPVVSNDYCAQVYSQYKSQKIDNTIICAGDKNGKDACRGDSGGPLMLPNWDPKKLISHIYQIGVVSYGVKCAEPGYPGVYTRATYFVPWLEEKILGTRQ